MSSFWSLKIVFSKTRFFFKIKQYLIQVSVLALVFISQGCLKSLDNGGLKIGWAIEDITPDGPVDLKGQYYSRVSEYVQSPLKATGLAIESTDESGKKQQAIFISIDINNLNFGSMQDSLKKRIKDRISGFDVNNILLNVIHTHTGFDPGPDSKHREMLMDKLTKVAIEAWEKRKPGGISWEFGYAVIGHNRRVEYADGSTEMYGSCNRKNFIGLEGPEDSSVKMLFCWDLNRNLTGIIMNVACPAQVAEGKYFVSSDYWGEVRKQMEKKYPGVRVLPQIGAAGDISPRDLPKGYKAEEPNMWDVSGIEEIGRRLMNVIDEAYLDAKENIETNPVFKHIVKNIKLPSRIYSKEEYEKAQAIIKEIRSREPEDPNSPETAWNRFLAEVKANEKIKKFGPWDNKLSDFGILKKQEALVKQYEEQDEHLFYPVEMHVIRLGDAVFASNPFELFVDYGFRVEARSKANATFLIQLSSGDYGGYLPTQRAVEGEGYRGYSALVNKVGPKGGQVLVDETVETINGLFSD